MSFARRWDGGGGVLTTTSHGVYPPQPTGRPPPPPGPCPTSPINCSNPSFFPPPNSTNGTNGTGTTVTSILTLLSLTTTMTSTISSNFISTTTLTSFSVTGVVISLPSPTMTAARAAETSLLAENASLTRGNTAATAVLGTLTILLMIAIAIFFFFWVRRRNRKPEKFQDDESPPITSMDMSQHPPPTRPLPVVSFRPGTANSIISNNSRPATALSTGPRGAGYGGAAALRSNPVVARKPIRPALAKRSSSAPNLKPPDRPPRIPTLRGMGGPAITILPNTSSRTREPESPPTSPMTPPTLHQGARRMPLYHEALQEEAERTRSRHEAEEAGRLGLPVIERNRSQRASVDSMGSDMERFAGGNGGNGGNGRERVLHSTRASSGIFPEGEEDSDDDLTERGEKDDEGNWSSRGSRGSGSKEEESGGGDIGKDGGKGKGTKDKA
ncbi:hypothetical protein BGZ60DRAFT_527505 [Tricladium varicosporioides]|nr:hypothetical protein BGZ60DRAFT_527505 [Hymenoscyphus varicosporioides]